MTVLGSGLARIRRTNYAVALWRRHSSNSTNCKDHETKSDTFVLLNRRCALNGSPFRDLSERCASARCQNVQTLAPEKWNLYQALCSWVFKPIRTVDGRVQKKKTIATRNRVHFRKKRARQKNALPRSSGRHLFST